MVPIVIVINEQFSLRTSFGIWGWSLVRQKTHVQLIFIFQHTSQVSLTQIEVKGWHRRRNVHTEVLPHLAGCGISVCPACEHRIPITAEESTMSSAQVEGHLGRSTAEIAFRASSSETQGQPANNSKVFGSRLATGHMNCTYPWIYGKDEQAS